ADDPLAALRRKPGPRCPALRPSARPSRRFRPRAGQGPLPGTAPLPPRRGGPGHAVLRRHRMPASHRGWLRPDPARDRHLRGQRRRRSPDPDHRPGLARPDDRRAGLHPRGRPRKSRRRPRRPRHRRPLHVGVGVLAPPPAYDRCFLLVGQQLPVADRDPPRLHHRQRPRIRLRRVLQLQAPQSPANARRQRGPAPYGRPGEHYQEPLPAPHRRRSRLQVPEQRHRRTPRPPEPQMRVGISGTHGTGKTTLAQALCAHLPGHVLAEELYYLLEEEGYEFSFPPSLEDYRALLARSVRSLAMPPMPPGVVFDRTPLDYLAYMAASGANPEDEADAAALRPALASLDLLVITLITPETEQVLPTADMPRLRTQMNDALLELVYDNPLNAWGDIPVLELNGPLDSRLKTVLTALNQPREPR